MKLLSTPFTLLDKDIPNRFLRSATMESMADCQGLVTDELLELYDRLAQGGSGIVITGCAAVQPSGRAWSRQLGAWDDAHIPGLERLARLIHTIGIKTLCAVQLAHQGSAGYGYSYGALEHSWSLGDLSEQAISQVIDDFAKAAARTVTAGFDAVAVHGAHGYLVSEFFSPVTNTRSDHWGGTLEKRMHFPLEVCAAIRREIGTEVPILWKQNVSDFIEGGAGEEEYSALASALVANGVDMIELSGGLKDQIKLRAKLGRAAGKAEAYFGYAVPEFRKAVGKAALAVTGGLRSLEAMESLLEQGVDFVGLCRPLISEPDLPMRLMHGPDLRKSRYTSCNKCLLHISKEPLSCIEFDPFQAKLRQLGLN